VCVCVCVSGVASTTAVYDKDMLGKDYLGKLFLHLDYFRDGRPRDAWCVVCVVCVNVCVCVGICSHTHIYTFTHTNAHSKKKHTFTHLHTPMHTQKNTLTLNRYPVARREHSEEVRGELRVRITAHSCPRDLCVNVVEK